MKNRLGILGILVPCSILLLGGFALTPVYAVPLSFDLMEIGDSNNRASALFAYHPGSATVHLEIENASLLYDPRMTAFAFNVPTRVTGISSFRGPSGWLPSFTPESIHTPGQYGFFDIAVLTGPNFGGGFPNSGIPRGSDFSFDIGLAGSDLDGPTELDFLELLSFDPRGGPDESEQHFIARWQRTGSTANGSDIGIPTDPPVSPVAEPATLLLFGSGMAGMAILLRRFAKITACVAVLLLAGPFMAEAEEQFGVTVYESAKYDAAVSKNVSQSLSIQAACYVTSDSVENVVEFYKKQPGLEFMGGNEEGAMFKKEDVHITIQNPWMDMKTGKMIKNTLVSMVKN